MNNLVNLLKFSRCMTLLPISAISQYIMSEISRLTKEPKPSYHAVGKENIPQNVSE